MTPGFVFFWTLLRVDPVPKAYPYVVALWITAAEVLGDAVLGLAVHRRHQPDSWLVLPRARPPVGAGPVDDRR